MRRKKGWYYQKIIVENCLVLFFSSVRDKARKRDRWRNNNDEIACGRVVYMAFEPCVVQAYSSI